MLHLVVLLLLLLQQTYGFKLKPPLSTLWIGNKHIMNSHRVDSMHAAQLSQLIVDPIKKLSGDVSFYKVIKILYHIIMKCDFVSIF